MWFKLNSNQKRERFIYNQLNGLVKCMHLNPRKDLNVYTTSRNPGSVLGGYIYPMEIRTIHQLIGWKILNRRPHQLSDSKTNKRIMSCRPYHHNHRPRKSLPQTSPYCWVPGSIWQYGTLQVSPWWILWTNDCKLFPNLWNVQFSVTL